MLLLAFALAALFFGCAQGESDGGAQETPMAGLRGEEWETYYMVVHESGNEYWYPVFEAFKQAGGNLGVKTIYEGAAQPDAGSQIKVLEQVLKKNPKGILLAPASANELTPTIDAATNQGVCVVTLAEDAPFSSRAAFVGTDHEEEGREAARAVAEELQGRGRVMALRNLYDAICETRTDAFIDTITREYPGMEIVSTEAANGDIGAATTYVSAAAQTDGGIDAVFCPDISSAIGASDVAGEHGASFLCICVDADTAVLERVTDGSIWMAVCADQGMQGYFGMIALFSAAHPELLTLMGGEPARLPSINSGIIRITSETAAQYSIVDYARALGYDTVEGLKEPGG